MVGDRDFRMINVEKTAELHEQKRSSRDTYRKKRGGLRIEARQGAVGLRQSTEEIESAKEIGQELSGR